IESPSQRPGARRPGTLAWWRKPPFYTVPALVLGVISLPLAIIVSAPILGVILASLALALALAGCGFALALRGAGLRLALISTAVSGAMLFIAIAGFPGIGKTQVPTRLLYDAPPATT